MAVYFNEEELNELFIIACKNNDLIKVKFLIEKLNFIPEYMQILKVLIHAIEFSYFELFQFLLLKYHTTVAYNNRKKVSEEIFIEACKQGHIKIVKLIFFNKQIKTNQLLGFATACHYNHLDIVKLLVPSNISRFSLDYVYINACIRENIEIINFLLTSPAINFFNPFNRNYKKLIFNFLHELTYKLIRSTYTYPYFHHFERLIDPPLKETITQSIYKTKTVSALNYILNHPKLKPYLYKIEYHDWKLKIALFDQDYDMVKYLIIEQNINLSKQNINYLKENNARLNLMQYVIFLLEKRNLNSSLHYQLIKKENNLRYINKI